MAVNEIAPAFCPELPTTAVPPLAVTESNKNISPPLKEISPALWPSKPLVLINRKVIFPVAVTLTLPLLLDPMKVVSKSKFVPSKTLQFTVKPPSIYEVPLIVTTLALGMIRAPFEEANAIFGIVIFPAVPAFNVNKPDPPTVAVAKAGTKVIFAPAEELPLVKTLDVAWISTNCVLIVTGAPEVLIWAFRHSGKMLVSVTTPAVVLVKIDPPSMNILEKPRPVGGMML